jgi:hypothetical protein
MLQLFWFLLYVPFSLYCISTYIKPLESGRNPRVLLIGILGLVCAAMRLRGTYSIVFASLPHPAILFRVVRALTGGMWGTMLMSMGFRRGARTMLIISCILFIGSPLALILHLHWIAPGIPLHSILASPRMYSLEAWPVGMGIPAIVLLWQSSRNDSESGGHDGGLTAAEPTVENGTGA